MPPAIRNADGVLEIGDALLAIGEQGRHLRHRRAVEGDVHRRQRVGRRPLPPQFGLHRTAVEGQHGRIAPAAGLGQRVVGAEGAGIELSRMDVAPPLRQWVGVAGGPRGGRHDPALPGDAARVRPRTLGAADTEPFHQIDGPAITVGQRATASLRRPGQMVECMQASADPIARLQKEEVHAGRVQRLRSVKASEPSTYHCDLA